MTDPDDTHPADPVPNEPSERPNGVRPGRERSVALVLAVAAVLAAAIATRASLLSSAAGGDWQSAVRTELKLGAAMVEDARFVYTSEAPNAFRVVIARIRAEEMRARAGRAEGAVRAALLAEADAQDTVAESIEPSSDLARRDRYARDDGGLDLGKRLADTRSENPELVDLDPDALQASGDDAADRAVLVLIATIPIGIAFLLGALAQAFARRRSVLVGTAWLFLVASAGAWVLTEVGA